MAYRWALKTAGGSDAKQEFNYSHWKRKHNVRLSGSWLLWKVMTRNFPIMQLVSVLRRHEIDALVRHECKLHFECVQNWCLNASHRTVGRYLVLPRCTILTRQIMLYSTAWQLCMLTGSKLYKHIIYFTGCVERNTEIRLNVFWKYNTYNNTI
jgi:hypothetical protein